MVASDAEPLTKRSPDDCGAYPCSTSRSVFASFALHALFGVGSGWLVIAACYTELVVYQAQFGLVTANRMGLAHDLGTLCVPAFVAVRSLMNWQGIKCNYSALIVIIAVLNFTALMLAARGIHGLWMLMLVTFIGGSCGYLVGVVHQAYLAMWYEDRFFAVFRAGDSSAGIICIILATYQQPWLQEGQGQRFGPEMLFLALSPLVALSLLAFWAIERSGAGRLPASEVGGARLADAPRGGEAEAQPPEEAPPEVAAKGDQCSGRAGICQRLLPAGALRKPALTAGLAGISFFLQFACWGIGDSIIPYACAAASPEDDGSLCLFRSGVSTAFACWLGAVSAVAPKRVSSAMIVALIVVFTALFVLLCNMATNGSSLSILGSTNAVVCVVLFMRILNKVNHYSAQRFLQTSYRQDELEGVNSLVFIFHVAGNTCGTLTATTIIALLL